MKERVVMFGDAVIAIIITVMVLELPIQYATGGAVDFLSLFRAVGIYFISFCFVANVWFQTAYSFNRIEKVKNKELVIYFLLLFSLSLVPSVTRLLIEDTTRQTVLFYGVVTLIVTVIMRYLILVLTRQATTNKDLQEHYVKELSRYSAFDIFFRVALLVFGCFFVRTALIIYLVLPILSFLQNIVDREEDSFVDTLKTEDRIDYFKERNELWGNAATRYSALLRGSLQDAEKNNASWDDLLQGWKNQLAKQIMEKQNRIFIQGEKGENTQREENDLRMLTHQKERLDRREEVLNKRDTHDIKQEARHTSLAQKHVEHEERHTERREKHEKKRAKHKEKQKEKDKKRLDEKMEKRTGTIREASELPEKAIKIEETTREE